MPATKPIPKSELGKLLAGLLAREVKASDGKPVPEEGVVAALFVDNSGAPHCLWLCDLAFAAASGAALLMMPCNLVEEAVASGDLPPAVLDSFREVANVGSSLMNQVGPHVRLEAVKVGALPDGATKILSGGGSRSDFAVEIGGYGKGALSIISL